MKVKDIMTTPVITAGVDAPVGDVANLLHKHRISAVPIVDHNGAVVGLISEFDLIARSGKTAKDIMTTGVISVTEDTDVDDVKHLLVDRRIRRVPVLAGQQLVGIVSRSDIVALLAMEWVCEVCGESVRSDQPPEECPRCHAPSDRFVHQEQSPGF